VVELTQAATWHRQVAALVAAAQRAGVGEEDLPSLRVRLLAQQTSFVEVSASSAVPNLVPSPVEIASAAPALGDLSGPAVSAALAVALSTLESVEAALAGHRQTATSPGRPGYVATTPTPPAVSTPAAAVSIGTPHPATPHPAPPSSAGASSTAPGAPVPAQAGAATGQPTGGLPFGLPTISGWRPGFRNTLVYGAYTLVVFVVQIGLWIALGETTLPLLAPVCLFVLPAFAWAAGWVTVGIVFSPRPGETSVPRTPRLGAVICLMPDVLLFMWLAILFVSRLSGA
jgi:hypothetical protein